MKRDNIPLKEKYALTVTEASRYYNIGPRRLRQMADQHLGDFAVFSGNANSGKTVRLFRTNGTLVSLETVQI